MSQPLVQPALVQEDLGGVDEVEPEQVGIAELEGHRPRLLGEPVRVLLAIQRAQDQDEIDPVEAAAHPMTEPFGDPKRRPRVARRLAPVLGFEEGPAKVTGQLHPQLVGDLRIRLSRPPQGLQPPLVGAPHVPLVLIDVSKPPHRRDFSGRIQGLLGVREGIAQQLDLLLDVAGSPSLGILPLEFLRGHRRLASGVIVVSPQYWNRHRARIFSRYSRTRTTSGSNHSAISCARCWSPNRRVPR